MAREHSTAALVQPRGDREILWRARLARRRAAPRRAPSSPVAETVSPHRDRVQERTVSAGTHGLGGSGGQKQKQKHRQGRAGAQPQRQDARAATRNVRTTKGADVATSCFVETAPWHRDRALAPKPCAGTPGLGRNTRSRRKAKGEKRKATSEKRRASRCRSRTPPTRLRRRWRRPRHPMSLPTRESLLRRPRSRCRRARRSRRR